MPGKEKLSMRKWIVWLVVFFWFLGGAPVQAETIEDYNGAYVLDHCTNEKDAFVRGFCLGYIRSLVDVVFDVEVYMVEKPRFCLGESPLKEWRKAILDWLRQDPGRLDLSARKVVLHALAEKFPCPQLETRNVPRSSSRPEP